MAPLPMLLGRLSSQAPTIPQDVMCKRLEAVSLKSHGTSHHINPADFVADGQQIIHQGFVWKLCNSGDPRNRGDYTCVMAWITSGAGIFYYSDEDDQPLGCNIRGFRTRLLEDVEGHLYAFELVSPSQTGKDSRNAVNTILAADSQEQRATWIEHLSSVQRALDDLSDLTPMDMFRQCSSRSSSGSRTSSVASRGSRNVSRNGSRNGSRRTSREPVLVRSSSGTSLRSPRHRSCSVCSQGSLTPEIEQGFTVPRGLTEDEIPCQVASPPPRFGTLPDVVLHDKANTVLVLDWDDTLFPTTWIRHDCGMDWRRPLEEQVQSSGERSDIIKRLLGRCVKQIAAFLTEATSLTSVFIVTLAQRGWVNKSVKNFAPELQSFIDMGSLKVIYAQDYVKEVGEETPQDLFRSQEQEMHFWTRVKAKAILKELQASHSENACLRSIISFGDAEFERGGTIEAAQKFACGKVSLPTKTLKLVEEPTAEELIAQLTLLKMWLPSLVARDGNLDIEIGTTDDDEELIMLHRIITGKNEQLSWRGLAGM